MNALTLALDRAFPSWRLIVDIVVMLAVAGAVVWYGEWRADAREAEVKGAYEAQIAKQKLEAGRELLAATERVRVTEQKLAAVTADMEALGEQNKLAAAAAERRIAELVGRNAGRLRDPNAPGCRDGGAGAPGAAAAPAGGGAGDQPQAGGLLSEQLSGLLQRLQREADEVNNAYAECRPWAVQAREILNKAGGP